MSVACLSQLYQQTFSASFYAGNQVQTPGPQERALFILHPWRLRVLLQAVLNKTHETEIWCFFLFVSSKEPWLLKWSCNKFTSEINLESAAWPDSSGFLCLLFGCFECCRNHDPGPAQTEMSIISQDNLWQNTVFILAERRNWKINRRKYLHRETHKKLLQTLFC